MSDEPETIEHDPEEKSAYDRRFSNRVWTVWAFLLPLMWIGAWWSADEPFHWGQIAMGAVTAGIIIMAVLDNTPRNMPFKDMFK